MNAMKTVMAAAMVVTIAVGSGVRAAVIVGWGDAGHSTTGTWNVNNTGWNSGEHFEWPSDSGSTSTWNFTDLPNGDYYVSASWTAFVNRSTTAQYDVSAAAGTTVMVVDQQLPLNPFNADGFGWWNQLSSTPVSVADGTLSVTLSDTDAGLFIMADAIRLSTEPMQPNVFYLDSNSPAGYSTTGVWNREAVGSSGTSAIFLADEWWQADPASTEDTATWSFTDLPQGDYRISATWLPTGNRTTDAVFTLSDGAAAVNVNQRLLTPDINDGTNWQDLNAELRILDGTFDVTLSDNVHEANNYLLADAVRLERLPERLIWDGPVDGNWIDVSGWDNDFTGSPAVAPPDAGNRARIDSNLVTVSANTQVANLAVTGGGLIVADGTSLDVAWKVDMAAGTSLSLGAGARLTALQTLNVASTTALTLGAGATLDAGQGGSIAVLDTSDNAVVSTGGDLPVGMLTAAGTIIKRGQGALLLDNTSNTGVSAAGATIRIEQGTVRSVGTDPLGGATGIELAGGMLSLSSGGRKVAYWSFDDDGNLGADDADNGHDAVAQGALAPLPNEFGISGGAVDFDGANRLWVDDQPDLRTFPNGLTVSFWADNPTAGPGPAFARWGVGADATGYGVDGANWWLGHGTGFGTIPSGLAGDAGWHHYALTWDPHDNNRAIAYRDGEKMGETEVSMAFPPQPGLAMGTDNRNIGWAFAGSMDEAMIYSAALDAAEVVALYETPGSMPPDADPINPASTSAVGVTVSADSTLQVTNPTGVSFASLTMQQGILRTSGLAPEITFAGGTTIPSGTTGTIGFDPQVPTDLGGIDGNDAEVIISKIGQGDLVLDDAGVDLQNATFDVQQGRLIGVYGASPFELATLQLSGGELVLAGAATNVPVQNDNAVTMTASSTLTAGTGDAGAAGPVTVTVSSPIAVGANTLTLQSTDDYTLRLTGPIDAPTGNATIEQGTIELTGAGGQIGTLEISDGVVNAAAGAVTITDTLRFGALQFTIDEGNTFGVSGTDLASETAARNVTLPGGTLSLVGPGGGGDIAAGIGVNFVGTGSVLGVDDVAGFPDVAHGNWNNLNGGTQLDPQAQVLNDNSAAATTATVTWESQGGWASGASATPDEKLFHGVIFRNGATGTIVVDVADIPYDTYDVYAYVTAYGGDRGGSLNIGDTTYFFKGADPFTGYVETTETGDFAAAPFANYAVFKDLTGDSFTFTQSIESAQVVLNGLQIVRRGLPPALVLPNTNLTVSGDAEIVSPSPEVELGDLTVLPGASNVNLSGAAYSVNNATIADGVTLDGEMEVRGALSIGEGIGAMTIGDGELALDTDAGFNVQVSLAGEEAPADKITLSGAAALQLGGTLTVAGVDRSASDFWANATRTIVDNPVGGAIGDVPSDSGFVFDAVTPDPTDDAISHHVGQGAFLREIEYIKAPVGPATFSVNAKLFIALGGDADGDGKVWLSDWAALRANFGNTATDKTWIDGNFDPWEDSKVWLSDWAALRENFGNSDYTAAGATAVPEPGTIAMLLAGLAGLVAAAWRRR